MIVQTRKNEHLRICTEESVEHGGTTLLEEVRLVHEALPECDLDDIDLSVTFCGKTLSAPVVIGSMTGGTAEAGEINRKLALVAQTHGLAIGLGSQRAMWMDPSLSPTYQLREYAPDVPILANLGVVQAREIGVDGVRRLVDTVSADALCLHLNPAQELAQEEGDRDFRGCLQTIGDLVKRLERPLIAKETGCGLGPTSLDRLANEGVIHVEVSGSGGTSWTKVEAHRNGNSESLGDLLGDWGVPTAASIVYAARRRFSVTASGGLRNALDVVRALALGADRAALALPFLRVLHSHGIDGLNAFTDQLVQSLRAITLLTGVRSISELKKVPYTVGATLAAWIALDPVSDS